MENSPKLEGLNKFREYAYEESLLESFVHDIGAAQIRLVLSRVYVRLDGRRVGLSLLFSRVVYARLLSEYYFQLGQEEVQDILSAASLTRELEGFTTIRSGVSCVTDLQFEDYKMSVTVTAEGGELATFTIFMHAFAALWAAGEVQCEELPDKDRE